MLKVCLRLVLFLLLCAGAQAQTAPAQTNGTDYLTPFPPHHVAGNIYFVGSKGLGIYLVTTPQGHILINPGVEDSVPLIKQSVEKLGFRFSDIKILLVSHAHFDHDAGAVGVKKLTGAKYMVMDADVPVVESGGKEDFAYGSRTELQYPPAKVDRVLHDGDTVTLGGTVLTAHLTAGHTKGCTTWTMQVKENGKALDVVIVGSPNVNPGYKLVNNPTYPTIAADYEKMFAVLKSLHCDIFLGSHGSYYNLESKYPRIRKGGPNPFIDPEGYKAYVQDREAAFRTELARQQSPEKFLLDAAAKDFHAHRPPYPTRFRNVRLGHIVNTDGSKQYMLCGEFLPQVEKGQAEWIPFATIKTSGYEQYLGTSGYCQRPNIVWETQDLSSSLQSQLDSVR